MMMKTKYGKYKTFKYVFFDLTIVVIISIIVYHQYKPKYVNFIKLYAYDNLNKIKTCNDVYYVSNKKLIPKLIRFYEKEFKGKNGGIIDDFLMLNANSEIFVVDTCRFNPSVLIFTLSNRREPIGYIVRDLAKKKPCIYE